MCPSPRNLALSLAIVSGVIATIAAQQPADDLRQSAVRRHVRAIETSASGSLDDVLARFEREHFSRAYLARVSAADRRDVMTAVRAAAADVDDVRVMLRDGRYVLILAGRTAYDVTFAVETADPFGIDSLEVTRSSSAASPPALDLTRGNLPGTFDRLEKDGWSGVVSVRLDGELSLERPSVRRIPPSACRSGSTRFSPPVRGPSTTRWPPCSCSTSAASCTSTTRSIDTSTTFQPTSGQ